MNKEDYLDIVSKRLTGFSKKVMIEQINNFYKYNDVILKNHSYKVGDRVFLKKGTLLHGTYRNIEGLKGIVENGLVSSWFVNERVSKYPSSVGVWNLKKDYYLDEYIDFYCGGTAEYLKADRCSKVTKVIPYSKMSTFMDDFKSFKYFRWKLEQTKEARFLPSLVQSKVQVGIIFNSDNKGIKQLLKYDILNGKFTDEELKDFVEPSFYDCFIKTRKHKDDFFTDRESAILFGIPACFIEGVIVGRLYEKDLNMLKKIKDLLPNCYICNLDGKVIVL